jgi:hypothetical protein
MVKSRIESEWIKKKRAIELLTKDELTKILRTGRFPNNNSFPPLFKLPRYKFSKDKLHFLCPRENKIPRKFQIPEESAYFEMIRIIGELWETGENITINSNNYTSKSIKELITTPVKVIPVSSLFLTKKNSKLPLDNIQTGMIKSWKLFFQEYLYIDTIDLGWVLRIDIMDFYRQVYVHSIPWALFGKEKLKEFWKNHRKEYKKTNASKLENSIMRLQDMQTNGLPVGPLGSDFLAEVLMTRIMIDFDESLIPKKLNYTGVRFKDDILILTDSKRSAELLLDNMGKILLNYELQINADKVNISEAAAYLMIQDWKRFMQKLPRIHQKVQSSEKKLTILSVLAEIESYLQTKGDGRLWYDLQKKYGRVISNLCKNDENFSKRLIVWFLHMVSKYPLNAGPILNMLFECVVFTSESVMFILNKLTKLMKSQSQYDFLFVWLIFYIAGKVKKYSGKTKEIIKVFKKLKKDVRILENTEIQKESLSLIKYSEDINFKSPQAKPLSDFFNSGWVNPSS